MTPALLAVALAGIIGAGTDGELTAQDRPAISVDANDGVVFGMRWRRPIVRLGQFRSVLESFGTPGVSTRHRLMIVGSGEGDVRAFDLGSGRERWKVHHRAPFETTVVILAEHDDVPELAIAPARDGAVLAFEVATGTVRWRGDVQSGVRAPATLVGDTLLLTTVANKVFALDVKNGDTRWMVGRPAPTALTVEGHSRATYHDGVVYAGFADGYIEAYHFEDGSRIWTRPLSFGGGEFVDADADPQVADGHLYVASYADGVYCLDLADGKTLWHRAAPAITGLALVDQPGVALVVAGSADGYIFGLQRRSGDLAYRMRLEAGPMSRLTIRRGVGVVAAGRSGLVVFDARHGRPLQATALTGHLGSDPAWTGDYVGLVASTGHVYAFSYGDAGMAN